MSKKVKSRREPNPQPVTLLTRLLVEHGWSNFQQSNTSS